MWSHNFSYENRMAYQIATEDLQCQPLLRSIFNVWLQTANFVIFWKDFFLYHYSLFCWQVKRQHKREIMTINELEIHVCISRKIRPKRESNLTMVTVQIYSRPTNDDFTTLSVSEALSLHDFMKINQSNRFPCVRFI